MEALAQGDIAERIAEQRDAADLASPASEAERAGDDPVGSPGAGDASPPVESGESAESGEPLRLETNHPEDQLPLGPSADAGSADAGDSAGPPAGGSKWMMNTLAALGVVIGLIFLLRWLAKKWGMGGGVRVVSSPIVEVLSRTTVAPKNHVVLLRVGSRILVVNDGSAGMRTLATVDDPDEVAGLLQSVESARETSMSNSFGRAMSKLSSQWSSNDDAAELGLDDSEAGVDRVRGALSGLRDRLRLTADAERGGEA